MTLPQLPPELWMMILKEKSKAEKPLMEHREYRFKHMISGLYRIKKRFSYLSWQPKETFSKVGKRKFIIDGKTAYTQHDDIFGTVHITCTY